MFRKEKDTTVWQHSADITQPIKTEKSQNEYKVQDKFISLF